MCRRTLQLSRCRKLVAASSGRFERCGLLNGSSSPQLRANSRLVAHSCPGYGQKVVAESRRTEQHKYPSQQRRCGGLAATGIVADGQRVTVKYTGKLEDGTVFDDGKDSISFVCGQGGMVKGFHKGILGMQVGETKELTVEPRDGFGDLDSKRIFTVPASKLPDGCNVGTMLSVGQGQRAKVVAMTENDATLDANHPLAGKTLHFTVTVESCEEVVQFEKLEVETMKEGDGITYPKKGDSLTMHYVGSLAGSGAVFDSSRNRDVAFTFTIGTGQVIAGWDEGVIKLSLGERAILKIPADMGYAARGVPGVIPPNSDLIFDVELLKIT